MLVNLKKNMPRLFVLLAVAMFLSGSIVAGALAAEFINPPETYAPEWVEPFPYQRNILWDFAVDPQGGPSSGGTPGAHYEGYLDDELKVSDYVEFTGNVEWFADGKIGLDGNHEDGTAIFHLDNLIDERPVKHIWIESDQDTFPGGSSITVSVTTHEGHTVTDEWHSGINDWYKIEPNPDWEDVIFTFHTPGNPSSYAYLDNLHIATESVPIPGTLLLMGSGLVGLIGVGRKKLFKRG